MSMALPMKNVSTRVTVNIGNHTWDEVSQTMEFRDGWKVG
jgi:hypothetical protein